LGFFGLGGGGFGFCLGWGAPPHPPPPPPPPTPTPNPTPPPPPPPPPFFFVLCWVFFFFFTFFQELGVFHGRIVAPENLGVWNVLEGCPSLPVLVFYLCPSFDVEPLSTDVPIRSALFLSFSPSFFLFCTLRIFFSVPSVVLSVMDPGSID